MGTLHMDGFEMGLANDDPGFWFAASAVSGGHLQYITTSPRTGNGHLRAYGTTTYSQGYLTEDWGTYKSELYFGFGLRLDSGTSLSAHSDLNDAIAFFAIGNENDYTEYQLVLAVDVNTRQVRLHAGDTSGTPLGTSSTALSFDTQYYIEGHVVIDSSTGSAEIRINQTTEINVSSVDTQPATNTARKVYLGLCAQQPSVSVRGGAASFYIDDFILMDTSGSVANSWPAGAGIEMLVPNADGNYTAWSSTEASQYEALDDLASSGAPDDDTSYISSDVANDKASVQFTDTTIVGNPISVMRFSYVRDEVSGSDALVEFLRISGTDYEQSSFVPGTAYEWHKDIFDTNPDTSSAWATSELDSIESGYRVA